MPENEVNARGNQPGTGSPAPEEKGPLPHAPQTGRNITVGTVGAPALEDKGLSVDSVASAAAAIVPIIDQNAADAVRRTGQQLCIARGCDYGYHGAPLEAKSWAGLRTHVIARHKDVNTIEIMRITRALMEEYEGSNS
jgi:hypothetical protein